MTKRVSDGGFTNLVALSPSFLFVITEVSDGSQIFIVVEVAQCDLPTCLGSLNLSASQFGALLTATCCL